MHHSKIRGTCQSISFSSSIAKRCFVRQKLSKEYFSALFRAVYSDEIKTNIRVSLGFLFPEGENMTVTITPNKLIQGQHCNAFLYVVWVLRRYPEKDHFGSSRHRYSKTSFPEFWYKYSRTLKCFKTSLRKKRKYICELHPNSFLTHVSVLLNTEATFQPMEGCACFVRIATTTPTVFIGHYQAW